MALQNLTYSFKTIKLILLWFYTFILFPYRSRTHLAFFGNCCCRSHKFPIYIFFFKKIWWTLF